MKRKTCCFALAVLGAASPILAQTNTTQTKTTPQSVSKSATQSLILKALKNLRSVSGPRPLTPEQTSRQVSALDRINDLMQDGTQALHNRNFVAAETDYQQLVRETMLGPFPYYGLGEALAGQGRTAEAINAYKTAVYWPLNTSPEAVAASQAIDNKPNLRGCCFPVDAVAWMKYAVLLSQTGQNAEAFSVYSQALHHAADTAHPEMKLSLHDGLPTPTELQAAAHVALGLLTNDTGNDRELAMSEFTEALRLAPDAPMTNYYYGYGWKRLDLKSPTRTADVVWAKAALTKAAASDDANVKKAAEESLKLMP